MTTRYRIIPETRKIMLMKLSKVPTDKVNVLEK